MGAVYGKPRHVVEGPLEVLFKHYCPSSFDTATPGQSPEHWLIHSWQLPAHWEEVVKFIVYEAQF